jgi:hypothetical protein
MPSEAALTAVETAIRDAVASNRFAEAGVLLDRYANAVEQLLRSLPPESEAARALPVRTGRLFDWARTMTLAAREYAAAEVDHLQSVSRYHSSWSSSPRVRADA